MKRVHIKIIVFLFILVISVFVTVIFFINQNKSDSTSVKNNENKTTDLNSTPSSLKFEESNSSKSVIVPQQPTNTSLSVKVSDSYTTDNNLVANILYSRNELKMKPIYRLANLDLTAQDILSAFNKSNSMPKEGEIGLILDANNLKSNGWKAVVIDNLNNEMLSKNEELKFLLSDEYLYFGIYNANNRFSIIAMNLQSPSKSSQSKTDSTSNTYEQNSSSSIITELPELTFDIDEFYEKLNSIGNDRTSPSFNIEDYIPKSHECYYVAVPYGAGLEKRCD